MIDAGTSGTLGKLGLPGLLTIQREWVDEGYG